MQNASILMLNTEIASDIFTDNVLVRKSAINTNDNTQYCIVEKISERKHKDKRAFMCLERKLRKKLIKIVRSAKHN